MANTSFQEVWYPHRIVECAGAVVVKKSTQQVILLRDSKDSYTTLPKGRLWLRESPGEGAVRKAKEETGYTCKLVKCPLKCLQPKDADEDASSSSVWIHLDVESPILMMTQAILANGTMQLVWWYLAEVDESVERQTTTGGLDEVNFKVHMKKDTSGMIEMAHSRLRFGAEAEVMRKGVGTWELMSQSSKFPQRKAELEVKLAAQRR